MFKEKEPVATKKDAEKEAPGRIVKISPVLVPPRETIKAMKDNLRSESEGFAKNASEGERNMAITWSVQRLQKAYESYSTRDFHSKLADAFGITIKSIMS